MVRVVEKKKENKIRKWWISCKDLQSKRGLRKAIKSVKLG